MRKVSEKDVEQIDDRRKVSNKRRYIKPSNIQNNRTRSRRETNHRLDKRTRRVNSKYPTRVAGTDSEWRDRGFSPDEANDWTEEDFCPVGADELREEGYTPDRHPNKPLGRNRREPFGRGLNRRTSKSRGRSRGALSRLNRRAEIQKRKFDIHSPVWEVIELEGEQVIRRIKRED